MDLSPEQDALVKRVSSCFNEAETQHKRYRSKWEHFYALYSNYTDLRNGLQNPSPRDRDELLYSAKREFGAELFIPMAFSTVETVLPRMIAQNPRMILTPRPLRALPPEFLDRLDDNAENLRMLIDAQQDQIHYELILQDVAKDGLVYGLGVQKTYWKRSERVKQVLEPHALYGWNVPCLGEHREVEFDDPFAECVDPFDFFWDPMGDSIETCDWVIHRQWRSSKYCMDKIQSKAWTLPLTAEELGSGGGRYDEVMSGRNRVDGHTGRNGRSGLHEVWEFHDGNQVVVVLDREWPVMVGRNPAWHGEIPFQVFRPTRVTHRMVGRGEIEPIEDLQQEINTLRSQRRDNATLKLMQSYAYQEGMVDPADVVFGAGMLIPMAGPPSDFLMPINVGDIPNSSYREEDALKGDVDRTSGVSDVVSGADPSGGVSSTATGAQLVQAAANKRIENKSRRLEVEVIASAARQWLALNQQKIVSPRPIQVPVTPSPDQPDRRYTWVTLGPQDLAGEFAIAPEGGSTAPENTPQKQQTAQSLWSIGANNPLFDQQKLAEKVLDGYGIRDPKGYLAPPPSSATVPPAVIEKLQQATGASPELVQFIVAQEQRKEQLSQLQAQSPQAQGQQGPDAPPVAA
ncbi:MAG: portal protein [Isosphaeraceae bacterium]